MGLTTLLAPPLDTRPHRTVGDRISLEEPARPEVADRQRVLRVGLVGFGRTGRDVAKLLLTDRSMCLEWVLRRSGTLEHRSVPEFLGVDSDEPGVIHSATAITARDLLDRFPVDVIIDFSSESGLDFYGQEAAARGIAIVTAISRYSETKQRQLDRYARSTRVLWSPNITLGINFMLLAAQTLQRSRPVSTCRSSRSTSGTSPRCPGPRCGSPAPWTCPTTRSTSSARAGSSGSTRRCSGSPPRRCGCATRPSPGRRSATAPCSPHATSWTGPRGMYRMEDLLLPYFAATDLAGVGHEQRRGGMRGRLASRLRAAARRLD